MRFFSFFASLLMASPLALLALPQPVWSCEDLVNEELFGATATHAQTGNGGLTVGVAETGDLTTFSWPSPSYYDQLDYRTASGEGASLLPRMGAAENDGVFAGLWYARATGESGMTWFRDSPWENRQSYQSDTSAVVETVFRNDELGLSVTQRDVVGMSADVLARQFAVERDEGSDVLTIRLIHYLNLAPSLNKTPRYPLDDWYDDGANDFGLVYDAELEALAAFRPQEGSLTLLDPLLTGAPETPQEHQNVVAEGWPGVRQKVGEGVWILVGGGGSPDQFQVGADAEEPCRESTLWDTTPEDAYADAGDGQLSGWAAAGCQANGALGFTWSFATSGSDSAEFSLFLAAGSSYDSARTTLEAARLTSFATLAEETDAVWTEKLAVARLPESPDHPDVLPFSQRWLVSTLQGMDRETGAIVASISTQPPYRQDWPRDSAFIALALGAAGFSAEAEAHGRFLIRTQFQEGFTDEFGQVTPRGAWAMNYYADGIPGGIIPFEIDQTALATWSLWTTARFLPTDSGRRTWMLEARDSVVLAADLLSSCVPDTYPYSEGSGTPQEAIRALLDQGAVPTNDEERIASLEAGNYQDFLPCLANEDDDLEEKQTLYGAHTVRLGLVAAAEMLEDMGQETARATWYRSRAEELAEAMSGLWWDEPQGAWDPEGGRRDWMLWPSPPYPADDPRALALVEETLASAQEDLNLLSSGGSYVQKGVLTLARILAADSERLVEDISPLVDVLVEEMPTSGTRHLGETWCSIDTDEDGVADAFQNHTATPHLWTASLAVLAAMAVYDSEVLGPVDETEGFWVEGDGGTVDLQRATIECGCTNASPRTAPGRIVPLLLLLMGFYCRRERR